MHSYRLVVGLAVSAFAFVACGSSNDHGGQGPLSDAGSQALDGSPSWIDSAADSGKEAASPSDGGPMCTFVAADGSAGPKWCGLSPSPVANMVSGSMIYGFAANDVWAVSDGGTILHYDGTSWTQTTMGTYDLNAIWGSAPNDIWIVGDGGTLLHYDGTAWSSVPSNTQLSLGWVWGSSSSNVWIVGDQGTVLQYTGPDSGMGWVRVDASVPTLFTDGGLGPPGDGDTPLDLGAVWTDAPNDVWIVGDAGLVLHWDGTAWTQTPTGIPTTLGLSGIWGTGPMNVWAAGDCRSTGVTCMGSTLLHWDGTSWTPQPNFPGQYDLADIWGFNASDIWVASDYGNLFHYDGTAWTQSPTPTTTISLNAMWGADPQHVWVIGDLGLILQEVP